MKNKKIKSTYDKYIEEISKDPKKKKKFDEELKSFYLSELILEFMEDESLTIRELAVNSGVSKSIIQNLRSSDNLNVTMKTMSNVLSQLGGELFIKRKKKVYPINLGVN